MGVMENPISMAKDVDPLDVLDSILTDKQWLSARRHGLRDVSLQIDPDNPTSAKIVSQWSQIEAAKKFDGMLEKKNKFYAVSGPSKLHVSPRRLRRLLKKDC